MYASTGSHDLAVVTQDVQDSAPSGMSTCWARISLRAPGVAGPPTSGSRPRSGDGRCPVSWPGGWRSRPRCSPGAEPLPQPWATGPCLGDKAGQTSRGRRRRHPGPSLEHQRLHRVFDQAQGVAIEIRCPGPVAIAMVQLKRAASGVARAPRAERQVVGPKPTSTRAISPSPRPYLKANDFKLREWWMPSGR